MNDSNLNSKIIRILSAVSVLLPTVIFLSGLSEDSLAAEMTTITIFEKIEIDSSKIFLGEIAQIDGNNHQLIQQLKEIVIGKAPLPNRSRMIKAGYIKLRLKQSGFNLSDLNLQSPPKVEISRSYLEIDKTEVKEIIIATNPTMEGEATAMYITRLLRKTQNTQKIRVTRIGRGLPTGADLEYADEITLTKSFEGRREY